MKVFILAGGQGTRLPEYTSIMPKPMVRIGGIPILIHIINLYVRYSCSNFFIATGYKSEIIKKYFKKFKKYDQKFNYKIKGKICSITLSYTGEKTLTGGRIKRLKKFLKEDENFMFTYGDGISTVNIRKLIKFHKKHKKMLTVTAVRPPARFGEISIQSNRVISFKEKPQVSQSWINGGFFVAKKKFLNLIKNDSTILEKKPLEEATKKNQLYAFKHYGFWKCMDTKRDKDVLEEIYKKNKFGKN